MKTDPPNRFLYMMAAALMGLFVALWAGAAMAYDSAPPRRMDYLGSMKEPAAEQGPAYDSAPPRRMDYLGSMKEPAAEQGPAYDSAPPRRMDFLGTHRAEPAE